MNTSGLAPTLLKLAAPLVGVALMVVVGRRRALSLDDHFGFRLPRLAPAAGVLLAWIAWISVEEVVSEALNVPGAKAWEDFPIAIVVLRIFAIGVAGPIAEETAFRGLLLGFLLRGRKLNVLLAIAITSLLWTGLHASFDAVTLGMVFLDGLWLGAARVGARSLGGPIAMHIIGNGFSIYQSLHS